MLGLWLNITTHKMILLPYLLFFFYVHNVSYLLIIFRKPTRPSLPLRKAPPFSQSLSSLRDERM